MIKYFFLATIILLPLQFALNISEGADLVTTRVLVPVLFLFWLVKSLTRRKIWIPNKAEMWLIVSFLFLSLLSLAFGREASAGFRKAFYLFTIFPVFFVAADIFRDEKWRKRGLAAIVLSGALASIIALGQFSLPYIFGIGKAVNIWENLTPFFLGNSLGELVAANSSWLVNIAGETRMRAFGFFPDPHNFSFFANLCIFSGVGYFFHQKKNISKLWIGVGLALTIGAVALSFSRGAYLGLIAGAVFFAIVFLARSNISVKAVAAAGAVLILITIFNSGAISQRLASSLSLEEGSNAERFKNWTQAVEIIRDYPAGGVGLGNYARTIDPAAEERSSIYAHNLYLDIAAETGILNAFVFVCLIAVSVWRNTKNGDMMSLGLAAGLVGFSVHSIFDTALWSPQVLTIFLAIVAYSVIASEAPACRQAGINFEPYQKTGLPRRLTPHNDIKK